LIIALTALLHCGCNRTGKLPPSQEENEEAAPDSGSPDNFLSTQSSWHVFPPAIDKISFEFCK
jgi:hypothetical protein